ncbi:MAG: hypothetical protein HC915_20930 [Anaerolineae bacterium]|nr:hypothetical protein [Anaerolineae bacterium]
MPGETLNLTLYWLPEARTARPLSFYVQVFGPAFPGDAPIEVAKLDSYPGRGLLRSDTWAPGTLYADTYRLRLASLPPAMAPFVPRLKIGWRDNATDAEILPTTQAGAPLEAVILQGGAVIADRTQQQNEPLAIFSGAIALHQAEVRRGDDALEVRLRWEALVDLQEDFTVFVHLVEPGTTAPALATGDGVPRWGWWPTHAWVPGHVFEDLYFVPVTDALRQGSYEILLGFYRPADFTRLPVQPSPYPDSYLLHIR